MLRVNKTRFLIQDKLCQCKYGLSKSVCSLKKKQNYNECCHGCKKLDDWSSCKDDYMWNLNTCDSDSDEVCKIEEYLGIKNCSCKKRLFGK